MHGKHDPESMMCAECKAGGRILVRVTAVEDSYVGITGWDSCIRAWMRFAWISGRLY